jgi:dGTPase
MSIRQVTEEMEERNLHPRACRSAGSRGRLKPFREDDLRTCFQRDRDRIIHSKAFRRLKHKTQVFLAPKGDHYRTRLTHVLEVSQIARTIARALRLNEDLTEAIALGHDLGHTPFGHAGEAVLREIHPGGFDHFEQSLRVVDVLERDGQGLNLTQEVRDGIVKHSKGKGLIVPERAEELPITLEGMVVRVSDVIAYVNHDLDDALRAGILRKSDIPGEITRAIGSLYGKRIDTMVRDAIRTTAELKYERVGMSAETVWAVYRLRDFLFERVYESAVIRTEFQKAKGILKALYEYGLSDAGEDMYGVMPAGEADRHRLVCDSIAGMTDRFALMTYERLFLPQQWSVL